MVSTSTTATTTTAASTSTAQTNTNTNTNTKFSNMEYTRSGFLDIFTVITTPNSVVQLLKQEGDQIVLAQTLYIGPNVGQIVSIPPQFSGNMTPLYAATNASTTSTSCNTRVATRPVAMGRKGSKRTYEDVSPPADVLGLALGMSTGLSSGGKLGTSFDLGTGT